MTKSNRNNPHHALIQERYPLTKAGSSKETHHITLSTKDLEFEAGDSVGIIARNDPSWVDEILEALHASGKEAILDPRSKEPLSLFEFFSAKANLARLPSSLVTLLGGNAHPNDDPLAFLKKLETKSFPLQEVCAQFAPLLPRFYSVASSPKYCKGELHLTVALLTYPDATKLRRGVASQFLCHGAQVGITPIPLYVQPALHFRLPLDPTTPLIMIGPGTGIAPFRAFLQERLALGATGKQWLFFGEQKRAFDFFYEEFFSELCRRGQLRLDTAFSRDQSEKLYVQHRMYEQKTELWHWLQKGAHLYVCGDADQMAKAVEATLHQIACEEGGMSLEAARAYFKKLRTEKRYLLDVY